MLKGSLSDEVRKKLYEQFVSGSLACNELTGFPELEGLVLDYQNLDPVNMVTGAYNFMYEDFEAGRHYPADLPSCLQLALQQGCAGCWLYAQLRLFAHQRPRYYPRDHLAARSQIFLTLRGGGYDSLADSGFVLENEADGSYRMTHEDGAAFIFSNDGKTGKLQTVYNPDGTQVSTAYLQR